MASVTSWPRQVLKALIRAYQLGISGFLGNRCRFYPSCSSYAIEAIEIHGAAKGSLMSARRLAKCHPLHDGGYDPVPGSPSRASSDFPSAVSNSTDTGVNGPVTQVH